MTRFMLFGAAVTLSTAVIATPVLAQEATQEPGVFAFYHPNGDLLHAGSARPADAMASDRGNMARVRNATMSHPLPTKRAIKAY